MVGTGGTVIDTTDSAAMRSSMGLGSAALTASTAYSLSGHAHAASDITSGTLSVDRGGTGVATIPANAIPLGAGASALTSLSAGGSGTILLGQGTAAAPIMANLVGSGAVTIAQVGSDLRIHAAASGGSSTVQRMLFQAPADSWRGVTANRPEPNIPSVSGMTSSTYCLSFDSSTVETAQRHMGLLPPDLATSGSVGITLQGAAASATSGSASWILSHKQYSTGSWTGAFTDFATVSAAIPGNTGSGYTTSWIGSVNSLGWSGGCSIEMQVRRLTTGASTHSGDANFHALNVREVTA